MSHLLNCEIKSKRYDDFTDNQHMFNTKKDEFRVTVLLPMLDSLMHGIEEIQIMWNNMSNKIIVLPG